MTKPIDAYLMEIMRMESQVAPRFANLIAPSWRNLCAVLSRGGTLVFN